MSGNFLSYLRPAIMASSAVAAMGSGLLYFKQNELIYPRGLPDGSRSEEGVPKPDHFGITDWQDLRLPTPDGETLAAYHIRPRHRRRKKKITVLMFHGNAGNIGHRLPIAGEIERITGCHVLMVEYRGYGLSSGTPDEKGLKIDAQTGLDWIRSHHETANSNVIVYGQSLGGAVAIDLVQRNQKEHNIVGLILENTFLSIKKLIPSAFPPAKYLAPLCHQYWASEDSIPQITDIPILFLSGLLDEIVPYVSSRWRIATAADQYRPSHMRSLFDLSRTSFKLWKEFPSGAHNDTIIEPGYFESVKEFINDQVVLHV